MRGIPIANVPLLLNALLLATLVSCGEGVDRLGGGQGNDGVLAVMASPITAETDEVIFTVSGDGIGDGTVDLVGTSGDVSGSVATATLTVPDGFKLVTGLGFDAFEPEMGQDNAPPGAYELRDSCSGSTTLQTSLSSGLTLTCSDVGPGTGNVGLSQLYVSGDYDFNAGQAYAGSLDGSNVSQLVIDGEAAHATITIPSDDGFACFERLPIYWPHPSTWGTCGGALTDEDGDWLGYIVARPGAAGTSLVQITIGSEQRWLAVRRPGRGGVTATGE